MTKALNHPYACQRRSKSWRLYVTDFPQGDLHGPFTTVSLHTADGSVPVAAERIMEDTVNVMIGDHANLYMSVAQARVLLDDLSEIVA